MVLLATELLEHQVVVITNDNRAIGIQCRCGYQCWMGFSPYPITVLTEAVKHLEHPEWPADESNYTAMG
jgi:hypothetical protein